MGAPVDVPLDLSTAGLAKESEMRRFEYISGRSSKFWQCEIDGNSLTIRWGRIGAPGQGQVKTFESAEKALSEQDRLAGEKLGKGYKEVSTADAGTASAPPPPPVAPQTPPTTRTRRTRSQAPAPMFPPLPSPRSCGIRLTTCEDPAPSESQTEDVHTVRIGALHLRATPTTLERIDASGTTILATRPAPVCEVYKGSMWPTWSGVAVSPDGRHALFNLGGDGIVEIDLETSRVGAVLPEIKAIDCAGYLSVDTIFVDEQQKMQFQLMGGRVLYARDGDGWKPFLETDNSFIRQTVVHGAWLFQIEGETASTLHIRHLTPEASVYVCSFFLDRHQPLTLFIARDRPWVRTKTATLAIEGLDSEPVPELVEGPTPPLLPFLSAVPRESAAAALSASVTDGPFYFPEHETALVERVSSSGESVVWLRWDTRGGHLYVPQVARRLQDGIVVLLTSSSLTLLRTPEPEASIERAGESRIWKGGTSLVVLDDRILLYVSFERRCWQGPMLRAVLIRREAGRAGLQFLGQYPLGQRRARVVSDGQEVYLVGRKITSWIHRDAPQDGRSPSWMSVGAEETFQVHRDLVRSFRVMGTLEFTSAGIEGTNLPRKEGDSANLEKTVDRPSIPGIDWDDTLGKPRIRILGALAVTLRQQHTQTGVDAHLDEASALLWEALGLWPWEECSRGRLFDETGNALGELFERDGDFTDLDSAIRAHRLAVAGVEKHGERYDTFVNNLAWCIFTRGERTACLDDMDEAIALQSGITDYLYRHPLMTCYLANLSDFLTRRPFLAGDREGLEKAEKRIREILPYAVNAPGHQTILMNLGLVLHFRFLLIRDVSQLEESCCLLLRVAAEAPLVINRYLKWLAQGLPRIAPRAGSTPHSQGVDLETFGRMMETLAALPNLLNALGAVNQTESGDEKTGDGSGVSRFGVLAESHLACFETTRRRVDLDLAIGCFEIAVRQTSIPSARGAEYRSRLGVALSTRSQATHDGADLDRAVACCREATEGLQPDDPNTGAWLANLGAALLALYDARGAEDALDEAIHVLSDSSKAAMEEQATQVEENLACALLRRFHGVGEPGDVQNAVRLLEKALAGTAPDSPLRGRRAHSLGLCLLNLGDRLSSMECIERAVGFLHEAVAAVPSGHPDRPRVLIDLASTALSMYWFSSRPEALEEAHQAARDALDIAGHAAPPDYHGTAGRILLYRFLHQGDRDDLDKAIDHLQAAMEPQVEGSFGQTYWGSVQGECLLRRYFDRGDPLDLASAVDLFQTACDCPRILGTLRSSVLSSLSRALAARYSVHGRVTDLDRAVQCQEEALSDSGIPSAFRVAGLANLGEILLQRYRAGNGSSDLTSAVTHLEAAARELEGNPVLRSTVLRNLGRARLARHDDGESLEELSAGLDALQEALASAKTCHGPFVPSIQHQIGSALLDLHIHTGDPQPLDGAEQALRDALGALQEDAPERPDILRLLACVAKARFSRDDEQGDPEVAGRRFEDACVAAFPGALEVAGIAGEEWGDWASERGDWQEAVRAYGYAWRAYDELDRRQLTGGDRVRWMARARFLGPDLAFALARSGAFEEAVRMLETGRARLLGEMLRHRQVGSLTHRAPEMHSRLCQATARITSLERRFAADLRAPSRVSGEVVALLAAARDERDAVVQEIRELPGMENFLASPTNAEFADIVEPGVPVVFLLTASRGSLLLLLFRADPDQQVQIRPHFVDEFRLAELDALLVGDPASGPQNGYITRYNEWMLNQASESARKDWLDCLEVLGPYLGDHFLLPLREALSALGPVDLTAAEPARLLLLPIDLLALLPWSAASLPGAQTRVPLSDSFTLSHAPSIEAVHHARQGVPDGDDSGLLAIADPRPVSLPPLPHAAAEVAVVAARFHKAQVLRQASCTRENVLSALPTARIVHFCCHGVFNSLQPLESGLVLCDDDVLTVGQILEWEGTGGRLAVLSACQTGLAGTVVPDECIGLPAAFLQAGYRGVISSLWAVPDLSTAILMDRFYKRWRVDGLAPDQALREAQRWVRDTTNREKALALAPDLAAPLDEATGVLFMAVATQDPDARSFEHPYWWAGFYLTGS